MRSEKKILTLDRLAEALARVRAEGGKIVLTSGCFDLLHIGHLRFAEAARAMGDCLVVAVTDEPAPGEIADAGRPILPGDQRKRVLAGLECVDYVTEFGARSLRDLLHLLKPDILAIGNPDTLNHASGRETPQDDNGVTKVVTLPTEISSAEIRDRIRMGSGRKK